jgi:ribosomal protein L14E/L6E/L27E
MGFFKNLMMKQMVKSQMKGVPQEQQDKIISAMEKNPQFFEDIAKKIEQKQKEGKDQMSAAMEVMRENQDELRKLMQ